MKPLFAFLFLFLILDASGQDLSGIWKGTLTQQPGGCFRVYKIELQLAVSGTNATGICYHYSDVTNYVKKDFEGLFNDSAHSVAIREQRVMTFRIPSDCIPCIRFYTLEYKKEGNKETLSGDWGGTVMNGTAACTPGRIVLTRETESDFSHIREIRVDTGTIRLDFYDNGEIDGDTISVLLNNRALVARQRLALKPITVEVKVDPEHPEQEITMVGENLGSIPPNTALLIVTAGAKRYKLFLTSTTQKNAMVRFIYARTGD
jgi:hypothetical protein